MKMKDRNVLLTGAAGGIGRHVAIKLARQGARVGLVGRKPGALAALQEEVKLTTGADSLALVADLGDESQRNRMITQFEQTLGPVELLINNAGVVDFHEFSCQSPAMIERIIHTNLVAPMLLTRAVLPAMLLQGYGRIVNIGSTFGSIGFAYFAAYASSKFAMRGFSESLRRELDGTGVGVSYLAPRAVKTSANSDAVYRMAEAVKMNMDEPEDVAQFIVNAICDEKDCAYFGWPEKLFVRINALLPGLVDGALRKQNKVMANFAPRS